jgi:hypothetical protein
MEQKVCDEMGKILEVVEILYIEHGLYILQSVCETSQNYKLLTL